MKTLNTFCCQLSRIVKNIFFSTNWWGKKSDAGTPAVTSESWPISFGALTPLPLPPPAHRQCPCLFALSPPELWCLLSRRRCSSALSSPSWQSSPSSCRPMANITTEILSEHQRCLSLRPSVSFHLLLCLSCTSRFYCQRPLPSVYEHVIAVCKRCWFHRPASVGDMLKCLPLQGMLRLWPISVQTGVSFFTLEVSFKSQVPKWKRKMNKSPSALFSFKRLGASEWGYMKQQLQINKSSSRGTELSPFIVFWGGNFRKLARLWWGCYPCFPPLVMETSRKQLLTSQIVLQSSFQPNSLNIP